MKRVKRVLEARFDENFVAKMTLQDPLEGMGVVTLSDIGGDFVEDRWPDGFDGLDSVVGSHVRGSEVRDDSEISWMVIAGFREADVAMRCFVESVEHEASDVQGAESSHGKMVADLMCVHHYSICSVRQVVDVAESSVL